MNFKHFISTLCVALSLFSLSSCSDKKAATDDAAPESNAVYYWRTVLELDSTERRFLRDNDVTRAYVRFFDIVVDKSPVAMDAVVPNATLQFKDTLPVNEIIPTIYITVDAMAAMKSNEAEWAQKIVKRVYNMCSYNELKAPTEIQLDCDWTAHTDSAYFNLCRQVKRELLVHNRNARLSSTIRLHQLSQTPPPVDYGVLMVYNTGSFENAEEPNSILTTGSVKHYLKNLTKYPLRLDYAYPIFSWSLVYQSDKFRGILNLSSDTFDSFTKSLGDNKYTVSKDTVINNINLRSGDIIRYEDAPFQTIMNVKSLIEKNSTGKHHSVILYNLDSKNISNYSQDEFKEIYK